MTSTYHIEEDKLMKEASDDTVTFRRIVKGDYSKGFLPVLS